jgi:hypothetical protein
MNEADDPAPAPVLHGSAAEAVGEELLSAAVDVPWDDYLGPGAADRVRDGSLGLVRHAYPPGAARDLRAASTDDGRLTGDDATRERLAAVAIGIAAAHHRPARLPHPPSREPYAWWIVEERTLVWMPWDDVEPPYGLRLLDAGEADAVSVLAPDACWTVFPSGLPAEGAAGGWAELPPRLRPALETQVAVADRAGLRWRRRGDAVLVSWRAGAAPRRLRIDVNRRVTGPAT